MHKMHSKLPCVIHTKQSHFNPEIKKSTKMCKTLDMVKIELQIRGYFACSSFIRQQAIF